MVFMRSIIIEEMIISQFRHKGFNVCTMLNALPLIVYEHDAYIEAFMPKLQHSDYYTEPKVHELAAKEHVEPGYCHWVKEFVVGRRGYGSVKSSGETDVRHLDLENVIQFNKCEVLVYMDERKKVPAG